MSGTLQEVEEKFGSTTFQKFPLTLVRGSGSTVRDVGGREYVDCMAGYGVAIIGHCNPDVVKAIKTQAERLITCHGSFYNDARAEFLQKLSTVSPKGLDASLLTNSGAESIEAAIKLARRSTGRKRILSMKGGFHGKTYGALSATWSEKYRKPFEPLVPGFDFAEYGDIDSLEEKVNNETAAVILEPIQGETGIIVPPQDYLKRVREACNKVGALVIFDEIQTGLGRTGKMWALEHWGVIPDIMTVSKGLGGGVPIGAAIATREIISSLKKGEHTSTFAGNPLACAAASATLDYITKNNLPQMAKEKGEKLQSGLLSIASNNRIVKEVRGLGLMLALQLGIDVRSILLNSIARGVIFAYSGKDTVRLLPPIVINETQMRKVLSVLEATVKAAGAARPGQD